MDRHHRKDRFGKTLTIKDQDFRTGKVTGTIRSSNTGNRYPVTGTVSGDRVVLDVDETDHRVRSTGTLKVLPTGRRMTGTSRVTPGGETSDFEASAGPAPAIGEAAAFDVRGRWQWRFSPIDCTAKCPSYDGIVDIKRQDPVTGALEGTYRGPARRTLKVSGVTTGDAMTVNLSEGEPHPAGGSLSVEDGRLIFEGTIPAERTRVHATLVKPVVPRSSEGGARPSASLVICNRDMTVPQGEALLRCNALVTDASGLPDSVTPTGSVAWTAEVGDLSSPSCLLEPPPAGTTASCGVTLRGTSADIPIGPETPITAAYPGDALYGPSSASPQAFGAASGYDETDQYGSGCNPASVPVPSATCGDPVNPATGNLSLLAVDIGITGRGPALAVVRTYNAQAAAAGAIGRFGAGWSDDAEARLVRDGKRVTVHLGTGATVPFTAKGKGFTSPGWVTATLTRLKDRGYRMTLADRTWFRFDKGGALRSFGDRAQAPIAIERDRAGAVSSMTDDAGRSIVFGTDAAGRVTSATDPAGRRVGYAYDDAGDLVAVTDVMGGITRYAYDDRHRLTSVTDPRGAVATTVYDDDDRVVRQTDPLGNELTMEYHGAYPDLVAVTTDGSGAQASLEYRAGTLVAETRGLGTPSAATTRYLYDEDMRPIGTVDARGGLWQETRDAAGNVLTTTDPLGRTTTTTWNKAGDPTSITSPLGVRAEIRYDKRGLVRRVTEAAGTPLEAVTTIARDDPAHPSDVTSITDPAGATTRFEYDAAGEVVRITDALGGTTTMERDILGWMTGVTDALGARTTITRDARGLATRVTDALGQHTSITWDAGGLMTSVTDALGAVTRLDHDAAGRSTAVHLPDGSTLSMTRDSLGDVTGQQNALGMVTTLTRDPLRRVTELLDALGNTTGATYDAAGDLLTATDALGQVTSMTWDPAGQLVAVSYDDGTTPGVTFTYDADGRRTSMTDGTGTTTYEYDVRDRLVSTTDGAGQTVRTTWDVRGGLTGLVYPDGLTVTYGRDILGRIVTVDDSTGGHSEFGYDAAGRLVRSQLGDGSVTDRTYDARGSLLAIHGGPLDIDYERDPLGRVSAMSESDRAPVSATRDVRGRLTALGDQAFEVDAAGSITSLRGDTLSYDAVGRLTQRDGGTPTTYTYDAAGRRIAEDGGSARRFRYDAAGRLTGVGSATWSYDGDGLRRAVTSGDGSVARFTWLTAGNLPALLSDGTQRYIRGPDGAPIAQIDTDGVRRWLHADQAGSVRAVTDDAGAVVATLDFDAYGAPTTRTGPDVTRLGFQGGYTDAGTGLQYLLARVYDQDTAQFLTVDPLVMGTLQPYAFAAGDPLTYADPAGLDKVLAGHGKWLVENGYTVVPPGTTMVFHGAHTWAMTDSYGNLVERGGQGYFEERFGPGSIIPNYTLSEPAGLTIEKTSRTVTEPTQLDQLLIPYQGTVHWAACRVVMGRVPQEAKDPFDPSHNEWFTKPWQDASSRNGWGTHSTLRFGDRAGFSPNKGGQVRPDLLAEPVNVLRGV